MASAVENGAWERAFDIATELISWVMRDGFLHTITGKSDVDKNVVLQTCETVQSWEAPA